MVYPAPVPDELLHGYKGRVIRINGWTSEKAAMPLMLSWFGDQRKYRHIDMAKVELLACVAGMDVPKFAISHTFIPLHGVISGKKRAIPLNCDEWRFIVDTIK